MDELTDEQLLAAYRTGDRRGLEILMDRYEPELTGFLTRLLGDRTAAEDVFQEAFLQVHISADTFDVSRRFKPWLFTIAANKGRDYFRKHGRHRKAVDLSTPVRGQGGPGGGDRGASLADFLGEDGPPLDQGLQESELREKVRVVVDAMPHHLREILLLAYFQRLSYNQIAESLGIPLGTVKSRLHAAVGNFAERWKRTMSPGEAET